MTELRAILWTGGDAPNREAQLKVVPTSNPYSNEFAAYWEPGYCGCPDCRPLVGYGETEKEAVAEYWSMWEEKHETSSPAVSAAREEGMEAVASEQSTRPSFPLNTATYELLSYDGPETEWE